MRDFFQDEINFEQVYHFSDNSPPIATDYGPPIASLPTYGALRRFLRVRFEQAFMQAGDNFWFFFAGHGVRHEDRDYLMPIDADPGDVEGTAIPLNYFTERLRRCGSDNVVMLIDACRSQGRRVGVGVGTEAQQGVITFFSCSPRESSYEIEQLRQGSFTSVLLQGLRLQGSGNCATAERLYQHLRYHVPLLNQRYGKPRQTPYGVVEPPTKYHLILLPRQATLTDVVTLKKDALRAEVHRDVQLARLFWIRVLAVSPADPEAIEGIERLSRGFSILQPPSQPAPFSLAPQSPLLVHLTRRLLLQIAGVSGGGVGVVLLGRTIFQSVDSDVPLLESVLSELEPETTRGTTVEFNVVTVDPEGKGTDVQRGQANFLIEDLGNGVSLEMIEIPGSSFHMGSPSGEGQDDEHPQHLVTVESFSMSKYPVTQAQWKAVAEFIDKVDRDLDSDPSMLKGDNRPVESVTWYDAEEFCKRLSQTAGCEYRLPSEAEWEYACRAGTTTPFHFGDTSTTDLANYNGNYTYGSGPKGKYRGQTTPVGSFKVANAFGLYDMHGNVWEWCLDHWHDNYQGAPTDGSAWITSEDDLPRLLRGGSWDDVPGLCRSVSRFRYYPVDGSFNVGLRVVSVSPRTLS